MGTLELALESVGCGDGCAGGTNDTALALTVPLELIDPDGCSSPVPLAPDGEAGWNACGGCGGM